jgi:penicillin-binding protein 1A
MLARKPIPAHDLKTTSTGEIRRRNIFWRWRRLFFLIGLLMATAASGVTFVLSQVELPNDGVVAVDNQTSYLCDATVRLDEPCNGSNAIAAFHGDENREIVKLADIPKVLQHAVLSAEDRDYFTHDGVNPNGILRAAWAEARGGQQGGSTITQQYVKNVFLDNERTVTRKLKEAVMAIKLEQKVGKEDILERYLNVIYFGRGAYGVQAASQAYFNKDVRKIELPEAALLAGLIRSPTSADPYDSPEEKTEAKRRRKTVLVAMEQEKYIDQAAVDLVDAVPLELPHVMPKKTSTGVDYLRGTEGRNQYFVEYVRQKLVKEYGEAALYGGGLRIYTTLDPKYQQAAYDEVRASLNQPGDPAGSLVAINDQGHIKAMMGGNEFGEDAENGQSTMNLAIGKEGGGSGRQSGSTFKAFALAEAVKQGFSLESKFEAPSKKEFANPGGDKDTWTVNGGCCEGTADLIQATRGSVNTVYAQLMIDLTPQKVIATAESLGVTPGLLQPNLASILGTDDVSVLDIASAYSTFSNNGTHIEPTSILSVQLPDGTKRDPEPAERRQALSPDQAAKVVHALKSVVDPKGTNPKATGAAANFGRPAAGKTGTTNDNVDAWFVGFTPRLTAAVWMGYVGAPGQPRKTMENVHGGEISGGKLPAETWKRFMEKVANEDVGDFPKPKGDVLAGRQMHPELHTTTTPPPPPTTQAPPPPPPTTDRPDWTWPKPTWPPPTDRPGNGGGGGPRPPSTPGTPSTPSSKPWWEDDDPTTG